MSDARAIPNQPSPLQRVLFKSAMNLQVFLLRHNWMGPISSEIMVVTTRGRRTAKLYSTPIGYLRDGESILALSRHGASNWFKNVIQASSAQLTIKGRQMTVRAESVRSPEERQRIFDLYRQQRRANFPRLFGVAADAPQEDLAKALATRQFVRFYPVK